MEAVADLDSPSNRGELLSIREVGLDRLSLSVPISEPEVGPAWALRTQSRDGWTLSQTVVVGGADVFVGARQVTGRWFGKVEYNPARVVDPGGVGLAGVGEAVETVPVVIDAASRFLSTPVEPGGWKVKRADLALDFSSVDHAEFILPGLSRAPRPYAKRVNLFNDPKSSHAATLWAGSGAGGVRLYDKARESMGRVPVGTLRAEVQARSDWLMRFGAVERLRDLNAAAAGAVFMDRAEWFRLEAEVGGTDLLRRVVALDLTPAREQRFIGWLVQVSFGSPLPKAGTTQLAEFRRLLRALDLTPGPHLFAESPFSVRLDIETGTEVVRVAA